MHKKRLKELQNLLKTEKLDGIILTRPLEIFFFSGFHQDRTIFLVTQKECFAFLPKMFVDHFKEKVDFIEIKTYENLNEDVVSTIKELKLKKVIFDPETENYLQGKYWIKNGLKEFKSLITSLRLLKEGEELLNVKKACSIAAKAFEIIKPKIKEGVTEREIAIEIEYTMQKMGASGKSFDLIVAFGPNSALPHHETSLRKLKKNEVVLIDFGCIYERYCSDMTRTFFYGKPNDEFLKVYDIVDKAQKMGIKAVKSGIAARTIDKICRDYISEKGYGQYFIHGTGHGVGLEIHEEPSLNTKSNAILKKGMTITVEPGIYLYGKFGIRIEDTVYVTSNGCEILTK